MIKTQSAAAVADVDVETPDLSAGEARFEMRELMVTLAPEAGARRTGELEHGGYERFPVEMCGTNGTMTIGDTTTNNPTGCGCSTCTCSAASNQTWGRLDSEVTGSGLSLKDLEFQLGQAMRADLKRN